MNTPASSLAGVAARHAIEKGAAISRLEMTEHKTLRIQIYRPSVLIETKRRPWFVFADAEVSYAHLGWEALGVVKDAVDKLVARLDEKNAELDYGDQARAPTSSARITGIDATYSQTLVEVEPPPEANTVVDVEQLEREVDGALSQMLDDELERLDRLTTPPGYGGTPATPPLRRACAGEPE